MPVVPFDGGGVCVRRRSSSLQGREMLMPFFFGALSRVWRQSRRNAQNGAPVQDARHQDDPHSYTVTVCSNEVALGRFIKRLSVSGAEHIKITYAGNNVACVRMNRPPGMPDWDVVVARLMDQCRVRCPSASTLGSTAEDRPAQS